MKEYITVRETTKETVDEIISKMSPLSSIWKESDFTYSTLTDTKGSYLLHVISPARRHYTAQIEFPLPFDLELEEATFPIRFHDMEGKPTTPYQLDDFFRMMKVSGNSGEPEQECNSMEILPFLQVYSEGKDIHASLRYVLEDGGYKSFDILWFENTHPGIAVSQLRLSINDLDRGDEMLNLLRKSKIVDIENKFIKYFPELGKLKLQRSTSAEVLTSVAPDAAVQEKSDVDPIRTLVEDRLNHVFTEFKMDEPFDLVPDSGCVKHTGVEPLETDNGLVDLETWYFDQFARIRVHALFKGRDKVYHVYIQTKPMDLDFAKETESFLNDVDFVNDVIHGLPILELVRRDIYDAESERRHERNNQIRERNGRLSFPGFSTLPPLETGVIEIPDNSTPNPWRSRLGSQLRNVEHSDVNSLVNRVINKDIPLSDITKLDIKITRDTEGNFNVAGSFSTTVTVTPTTSRRPGYGISRNLDNNDYTVETREERRERRERERNRRLKK